MIPKDWTLLVIASANKSLQPVYLQKALFLLGQKLSAQQLEVTEFYQFEPYDYGPFCSDVYNDAENLSKEQLISIDPQPFLSYRLYSITETGKSLAKDLRNKLTPEITSFLDNIVSWVSSLPFNTLVSAIYKFYPDMKKNSVFKE